MDKPTRVMLDANVLLNGVFLPVGPSTKLFEICTQVQFFVGEGVLREAENVIRRHAPSPEIANVFVDRLGAWIRQLNVVVVGDPKDNGESIPGLDEGDRHVYLAAQNASCEFICTYNWKHFPSDRINVLTPLGLLRKVGDVRLDNMIQYPLLGQQGTLFFMGDLHHPSAMGLLFQTADGISVRADEKGDIVLDGLGKEGRQTVKGRLAGGNKPFAFLFRYKMTGDFEALSWMLERVPDADEPFIIGPKQLLSSGNAKFCPPVTPGLFFRDDHQFFGHVQNLSGMPRYIREKDISFVIQNFGLEAIDGSVSVAEAIKGWTS